MRVIREPDRAALSAAPREKRVVALVGNTQVGLWAVRSLGRAGLKACTVCTSSDGLPAHSRYASGAWVLESGAGDVDGFLDEVRALVDEVDAGSVLTIAEAYHRVLIDHRERFEPDVHVFSPPAEAFRAATDKDAMHHLCTELGVPVAKGMTLEELEQQYGERPLRFPLVLRTRNQNVGGRQAPWKAAYAVDDAQLAALAESVVDIASNVIVQEYHPGAEDHVQVLMHEGEAFMVGQYIGEHHFPLAGGVTVQRVSYRHPGVERDAVRLLQAIGWQGAAGVQFHTDPSTGQYIFLEINPRFIGGLPTVIMAGFDIPHLLWQSHFEPERMQPTPYRLGVRTRILGGDANWLLGMIRGDALPPDQRRLGKLSAAARFLWHCGPWTRDDVWSWRDPKPFIIDFRGMLGKLRGRKVDLIGNPETRQEAT